jgi:Raf kinase inhibitor-like YbhB/YbcL family protein
MYFARIVLQSGSYRGRIIMKKIILPLLLLVPAQALARQIPPQPEQPVPLAVTVGIAPNQMIADKYAYCVPDGAGKTKDGGNINPAISWSGAPKATKSYAIIVVDPDVPASFELANQPRKVIPENFPRRNFYHWVLVDIPSNITSIAEGADSKNVTEGGKPTGKLPYGLTGKNDYPGGGYDGPCPPWNDERLHHYHFQVYALDVENLKLPENFTGADAMAALQNHIWAKGEVVGTFSNNPKLR